MASLGFICEDWTNTLPRSDRPYIGVNATHKALARGAPPLDACTTITKYERMEALLLILSSVAIVIALYMGLLDDRRPRGAPQRSLFRTFDSDGTGGDKAGPKEAWRPTVRGRSR